MLGGNSITPITSHQSLDGYATEEWVKLNTSPLLICDIEDSDVVEGSGTTMSYSISGGSVVIKGNNNNSSNNKALTIRVRLVATAACAMGIRQNDVALGLVGDKAGIGKTSFFEMLVPPCLNEYYQVAQKDERLFSMPNGFTQRFILNFDEFAAIGKHNEELFKMYMSASEIEIKRPGSRYAEKAPRVASCCFTSNKNQRMGGFISKPDAGLMRRLAVIEVDFIDDCRKRLDVDQLWAEAVMLLDGQYDPQWSQQEYRQFVDENRQYVIETNALRLIRIYYRKPEEGEECQFMTAMEVVLQLKKERKISSAMQQVNEVTVGQALTALGYKYYTRRFPGKTPYHGYDIVPLYEDQGKK
jgi:predicted P-loop ATPase